MKKSRVICLILPLILLVNILLIRPAAAEVDASAATNGSYSFDASTAYLGTEQLVKNVTAAIMYELNTDTLMYAWNPDAQVYPSSLVKILTTLIAVEKGDLDAVITVDEAVLQTVPFDAVSVELKAGEQMTLSDLLYCMMVGSANDAAAVIADHICGSQDAFVAEMNRYAAELGCTATNFTNVHGLHDDAQYTTARDMGRILAAAMKNEDFMVYFSQVRYLVPATNLSEQRSISSGNYLMNDEGMEIYYDARVTGGRTGLTNDGNRCLAASAEWNDMKLICIVLGSQSTFAENGNTVAYGSFKEVSTLLDAGFNGCKVAQVLHEGQSVRQMTVVNGNCDVVLGPYTSVMTILPESITTADLSFQYKPYYEELKAPVSAGECLMQLQIWNGNVCVAQADLYALNDVVVYDTSDAADLNDQSASNVWKVIVTVLVVLLALAFAAILLMRFRNKMKAASRNRRTRRYRRGRRRSR